MEKLLILGTDLCTWLTRLSVAYLCQGAGVEEQWHNHRANWSRRLMRPNQFELHPLSIMFCTAPAKHRGKWMLLEVWARCCAGSEQVCDLIPSQRTAVPVSSAGYWVGTALCWHCAVNSTYLEYRMERTSTSEVRASFIPQCVCSQP